MDYITIFGVVLVVMGVWLLWVSLFCKRASKSGFVPVTYHIAHYESRDKRLDQRNSVTDF